MFHTTCIYCMSRHLEGNEAEDCLRCPVLIQWFHKKHVFICRVTLSALQKNSRRDEKVIEIF